MSRPDRPIACAALGVALAAAACKPGGPKASHRPPSLGRPLAQTPARALAVTPDRRTLLFIGDVRPPAEKTAPEGILVGVLHAVAADGGPARALGSGVPTTDDGYRISPDGRRAAFLSGYRFLDHSGDLQLAELPSGDARLVAAGTSFYGFAPAGSALGYVAFGQAHRLDLATGQSRPHGPGAATFSFSPDGQRLLVRRQAALGSALELFEQGAKGASRLAAGVGEYKFSPDGSAVAYTTRAGGPAAPYELFVGPVAKGARAKVASDVADFAFSPDGRFVAYVAGVSLQKPLAELFVVATAGGKPRKVGDFVDQFQFAADSRHLAWREYHEDPKRGIKWHRLMIAPAAAGAPRRLGDGVRTFLWSRSGKWLAFLQIFEKPHYSLDLMLHAVDAANDVAPGRIERGVFGYAFSPGDRFLYYRSACVRAGRACDLSRVEPDRGEPAVKIADGVWDFRASESGARMLVTYARADSAVAADLAWLDLAQDRPAPRGVDQHTVGAPLFLDPDGKRAAYLVGQRKREGVYVADLP